jgi:hypothetical protein
VPSLYLGPFIIIGPFFIVAVIDIVEVSFCPLTILFPLGPWGL